MNNDLVLLKTFKAFFAAVEFMTAALYERSREAPRNREIAACASGRRARNKRQASSLYARGRRAAKRHIHMPVTARRYSCPCSEGPATMSLRRPPTRVELKADDIIEYEEVSLLVTCSVGRKEEKCGILFVPLHSSSLTFSSPHLLHLFT